MDDNLKILSEQRVHLVQVERAIDVQRCPPGIAHNQMAPAALDPATGKHWVVLRVGGFREGDHTAPRGLVALRVLYFSTKAFSPRAPAACPATTPRTNGVRPALTGKPAIMASTGADRAQETLV